METLIRLSTAHARARLSKTIDEIDAQTAVEMVQFSHFQKVLEKPNKRKRSNSGDQSEDDSDDDMEIYLNKPTSRRSAPVDGTDTQPSEAMDTTLTTTIEEVPCEIAPEPVSESKMKEFRQYLLEFLSGQNEIEEQRLYELFANNRQKCNFSEGEIKYCLEQMKQQDKVFIAENIIHLI